MKICSVVSLFYAEMANFVANLRTTARMGDAMIDWIPTLA
jgi:hypothetical protein